MGVFDKMNDTTQETQAAAIRAEGAATNSQVVDFHAVKQTGELTPILQQLWERKIEDQLPFNAFQYYLFENRSIRHAYFQPYYGLKILPGEHHILLKGTLDEPMILQKGGIVNTREWSCPNSEHQQNMFNASTALKEKTDPLKWDWDFEFSSHRMDWLVQLRPVGQSHTHLMMRAGRYGGTHSVQVGILPFLMLSALLLKVLRDDPSVEAKEFLKPCTYGDYFEQQVIWSTLL